MILSSKHLLKLSLLQMAVSVSLLAQYSHFPLTSFEIDEIESVTIPKDFSDSAFQSDNSEIFTPTLCSNQLISLELSISPTPTKHLDKNSTNPSYIEVGISQEISDTKSGSCPKISDSPSSQTFSHSDSSAIISDIISFIKDIYENDANFSAEKFFITPSPYYNLGFNYNTTLSNISGIEIINTKFLTTNASQNQSFFNESTPHNIPPLSKEFSDNSEIQTIAETFTPPPSEALLHSQLASNESLGELDPLNIFELPDKKIFINPTNPQTANTRAYSQRNRRGFTGSVSDNWTNEAFNWEMNSFEVNGTGDAANETFFQFTNQNTDNLDGLTTSNPMTVNITATGGVGNLSVFAYGHVGGGNWQNYTGTNGFLFMQGKGGPLTDNNFNSNWTDYITLDASGINAWLNPNSTNHNYFTWGVHRSGDRYYFTYTSDTNLSLSQAPEPSTYVMTGALLCFIGFNQKSRKSLINIFNLLGNKLKLPACIEKLTRSQSHS